MAGRPELEIAEGPDAGRRFAVSRDGLRMGRSTSNDIHYPEIRLSRHHCLFERDGDGICVIDLSSANGTFVNGEPVGDVKRPLKAGDKVEAGGILLNVVEGHDGSVDLGLGGAAEPAARAGAQPAAKQAGGAGGVPTLGTRLYWIAAAALAVLAAAALLLPRGGGRDAEADAGEAQAADFAPAPAHQAKIISFLCERVDAGPDHISRYAASCGRDGMLSMCFDDIPGENRRTEKTGRLSDYARGELETIFFSDAWKKLEERYTGPDATAENTLRSSRIRLVSRDGVKEVRVENTLEPRLFKEIRERLEVLVNNELGVQSVQRSRGELLENSAKSEELGDAKWDERDVEHGNIAACISHYRSAKNDLATLKADPAALSRIQKKIDEAAEELDKRCKAARFDAERARQIGDWARAKDALRILLDTVPDKADPRHAEADAMLVEIENRIQELTRRRKGKGTPK